eukprot:scaffold1237_cov243-Pinguiococcus_pyrenoidosus.AAC.15
MKELVAHHAISLALFGTAAHFGTAELSLAYVLACVVFELCFRERQREYHIRTVRGAGAPVTQCCEGFGERSTAHRMPFAGADDGNLGELAEMRTFPRCVLFDQTAGHREHIAKRTVGLLSFIRNVVYPASGSASGDHELEPAPELEQWALTVVLPLIALFTLVSFIRYDAARQLHTICRVAESCKGFLEFCICQLSWPEAGCPSSVCRCRRSSPTQVSIPFCVRCEVKRPLFCAPPAGD